MDETMNASADEPATSTQEGEQGEMNSPHMWTMKASIFASDFEGLKRLAAAIVKQIAEAKSFKDLPNGGGSGGSGFGHASEGYTVECKSPVEQRIVQLRMEADELEASLGKQRD